MKINITSLRYHIAFLSLCLFLFFNSFLLADPSIDLGLIIISYLLTLGLFKLKVIHLKLNPIFFIYLSLFTWIFFHYYFSQGGVMRFVGNVLSSSGLFFGFLMGCFLHIIILNLNNIYQSSLRDARFFWFLTNFLFFLACIYLYHTAKLDLRADISSVADDYGYQTAGDYALLLCLAVALINVTYFFQETNPFKWMIAGLLVAGFLFILLYVMFLGSKKTPVLIFTLLSLLVFSFFKVYSIKDFLRISFFIIPALLVIALILLQIQYFVDFLSGFAVFGFGVGNFTSISSRMEILMNNGFDILMYSPLLGSIDAPIHTTGEEGAYIHSFLLDLQSSFGLVGSIFMLLVLLATLRNGSKPSFINNPALHHFTNLTFITLFCFSLIATGNAWFVVWFMLGFITPPFVVKQS